MADTPFDWLHVGHSTDAVAMTGCTVIRFARETHGCTEAGSVD
jgi:hypothetical protein